MVFWDTAAMKRTTKNFCMWMGVMLLCSSIYNLYIWQKHAKIGGKSQTCSLRTKKYLFWQFKCEVLTTWKGLHDLLFDFEEFRSLKNTVVSNKILNGWPKPKSTNNHEHMNDSYKLQENWILTWYYLIK